MLKALKQILQKEKIDFFLLPNSDEFFLEYLPNHKQKIKALTGFSGSNAFIIFTQNKHYFFTDGRYILQAKNQLDENEFEIINLAKISVLSWLRQNITNNSVVAFDEKLFNVNFVKKLNEIAEIANLEIKFLGDSTEFFNLFSQKLQNITEEPEVFCLNKKLVGIDSLAKRQAICSQMQGDALVISKPENVCWLLNIRSNELENTPLFLGYAILFKSGKVDLFINENRIKNKDDENLQNVSFIQPNCIDLRLKFLVKNLNKIQIDENYCNYFIYNILEKNNYKIIFTKDPIDLAKSLKSDTEIRGAIKAHKIDGLALTKFLFWIENAVKNNEEIDEILVAKKLLEFRKQHSAFFSESFPAISAFGKNGSIIHYQANKETNIKIDSSNLYLIDSGAQYLGEDFLGTTDVTRTISFKNPTSAQIANFTRVLKGHISLSRAKFKKGTSGSMLDVLARFHLWQDCKDYAHGTGHGVGSFLSVHEGPQSISLRSNQELFSNMVLSNEPGYYEDNNYGIRIENLMYVEEIDDEFLSFKNLTLAPIDVKLIDFKMLTYPEKKWLKNYHQEIYDNLQNELTKDEILWLKSLVEFFNFNLAK